jgi:hypothetical protein
MLCREENEIREYRERRPRGRTMYVSDEASRESERERARERERERESDEIDSFLRNVLGYR